ncbi:MAG: hypothetical protein JRE36_05245 [Deltaproteobacteria bacterium]|nr:hypothetical protein [Deltaproteobacteria bacterium]
MFYSGDGHKPCKLGDDELVTALLLPPADNSWRQGYLKKSIRGAVDFAIATLAMRIRKNGPEVEDIRIALNGVREYSESRDPDGVPGGGAFIQDVCTGTGA